MTSQLALFDWTGTPEAEASFAAFDASHPEVWAAFERFTFEAIRRG